MHPNTKTGLLVLALLSLFLVACNQHPDPPSPGMPDGEHIAASPTGYGLYVTVDHENGVICYRERSHAGTALECMPYAEPNAPIVEPAR